MAGIARRAPATLAASRPPARMTGTSRAIAAASASAPRVPGPARMRTTGRVEEDPLGTGGEVGTGARLDLAGDRREPSPARRSGYGAPSRPAARWLTPFRATRRRSAGRRRGRRPRWQPRSGPGPASAVIATTSGRRSPAPAVRASRASAAASSSASARGVPSTRLSPIASAPAATAARTPASSVTPQIFTNGRRATLPGSSGAAPAATKARAAAAGSPARTSASPTRAPSNPSARQRATVRGSRTPDSAITSRSSGTRSRRRPARSTSTSSVRRSRLLSPISRAPLASARSSSRGSWTSTSGSSPTASARSTRRASRRAGWRTASSSTRSAPAARRSGSWTSSTTKSLARTGTATAARTARRSSIEPPNQCGSHSTEIAAAPPAS